MAEPPTPAPARRRVRVVTPEDAPAGGQHARSKRSRTTSPAVHGQGVGSSLPQIGRRSVDAVEHVAATPMEAADGETVSTPTATTRPRNAAVAAVAAASRPSPSPAGHMPDAVAEFQAVRQRANELFDGLRDLPLFGRHHWQGYFSRTFDVHSRLWKLQQQHRAVLASAPQVGLTRWRVGEIASRIGQLYYHYYLRTSDTQHLAEAFVFYQAIQDRGYFALEGTLQSSSPSLLFKRVRFLSRFVVVSLLLGRATLISDTLLPGMREALAAANTHFAGRSTEQVAQWERVCKEVDLLLQAEYGSPCHAMWSRVAFSRTQSLVPKLQHPAGRLAIVEAIIASSGSPLKISELTLDMFRVLQSLELEHSEGCAEAVRGVRNPHKYLLYRPSARHFLAFLAAATKEMPEHGALFIYISSQHTSPEPGAALDLTGADQASAMGSSQQSVAHGCGVLRAADLQPFTRSPLLLVVDTPTPHDLTTLHPAHQAALLIWASPQMGWSPTAIEPASSSLLTLALYDPLRALLSLCPAGAKLDPGAFDIGSLIAAVASALASHCDQDGPVLLFMQDVFACRAIVHMTCGAVLLHHHREARSRGFQFVVAPALPTAVLEAPLVRRALAACLAPLAAEENVFHLPPGET